MVGFQSSVFRFSGDTATFESLFFLDNQAFFYLFSLLFGYVFLINDCAPKVAESSSRDSAQEENVDKVQNLADVFILNRKTEFLFPLRGLGGFNFKLIRLN
jgi:hypothetical protein